MMDQQNTNTYVAVLVYESFSMSPDYETLFEESFMLVKASSVEEARQKTQHYTDTHTSTFKNAAGDSITWKLKHIVDVNQVLYDVDLDGAEIYARHFRNYQAYKEFEPLLSGEEL
jgi:Domain of unknown function (DUF4288)